MKEVRAKNSATYQHQARWNGDILAIRLNMCSTSRTLHLFLPVHQLPGLDCLDWDWEQICERKRQKNLSSLHFLSVFLFVNSTASSTQIDEPLAEMVRTGDTSRNLHVPYMSLGAVHMLVHLILKATPKSKPKYHSW